MLGSLIVNTQECREHLGGARVARLATIGDRGPHVVPIVFVVARDTIFTAVDGKPKRSRLLKRLSNIERNPAVAVLADRYDEDWDRLWWVRADGTARVVSDTAEMRRGIDLLVARYEQYRDARPVGPLIEISIANWTGWAARATKPGSV